jgi:pimeloyl-ACP methyl ester carboxylesterase
MSDADQDAPPAWFSIALSLTPEPLTIRRDGRAIRVYRWGDPNGRPLILLHGFGANAHWWDHIGPQLLADGLQVAAVDLAGHGESDYPSEYTLTSWAADLAEVYRQLSADKPLLIGHSAGGRIAWKTAELYGEDLLAVVSVDGPVPPPAPQPETPKLRSRFRLGHRVYPDRDEILQRFQLRPHQPALPYVLRHIAERSIRPVEGGWTWAHDARIYHRPRTDEIVVGPLGCPLFLVLAEKGRTTAEAASVIRSVVPQVSVSTIPAAAHHVMLDQPLALVSVLRLITDLMTAASPEHEGEPDPARDGSTGQISRPAGLRLTRH